jgi:hypothetical protein
MLTDDYLQHYLRLTPTISFKYRLNNICDEPKKIFWENLPIHGWQHWLTFSLKILTVTREFVLVVNLKWNKRPKVQ